VDALIAPSDCTCPSPQLIETSRILAVDETFTVNVAGTPADTCVDGGVMLIPVRGLRPTLTSAVFPATFAVTFAGRDVVRTV
jgi:hypothetical protein